MAWPASWRREAHRVRPVDLQEERGSGRSARDSCPIVGCGTPRIGYARETRPMKYPVSGRQLQRLCQPQRNDSEPEMWVGLQRMPHGICDPGNQGCQGVGGLGSSARSACSVPLAEVDAEFVVLNRRLRRRGRHERGRRGRY